MKLTSNGRSPYCRWDDSKAVCNVSKAADCDDGIFFHKILFKNKTERTFKDVSIQKISNHFKKIISLTYDI